jgi:hypothetical protein
VRIERSFLPLKAKRIARTQNPDWHRCPASLQDVGFIAYVTKHNDRRTWTELADSPKVPSKPSSIVQTCSLNHDDEWGSSRFKRKAEGSLSDRVGPKKVHCR